MTASQHWHHHQNGKSSLPPVSSILTLSADHFNSEMFHGSSFQCDESLQSSPSTSMGSLGYREPLRTRQPFQQHQPQHHQHHYPSSDSTATYNHHPQHSTIVFEHHQRQQIKHAQSSPAIFNFARKRRSIQCKLDQPQRACVYVAEDSVIHQKDKPLQRLIENQLDYLPSLKSMKKFQKEITTEFRKNAVQWLEEVCIEAKCEVIVFPLAINLMDRFLSKKFVPKMHLQALASACLLISGKVKAPVPLTAKTIAYYTDGAVTVEQLLEWELAVTATLNWHFYSPTAFEFFDQILTRTSKFSELKKHFQKACYRLFQDEKLACQKPSHQAAYCLGFAAVDFNDQNLYHSTYYVSKEFFGLSKQTFIKGVNAIGKLFMSDPEKAMMATTISSSSSSRASSAENYCNAGDEGSPNKIQKIDESLSPQHLTVIQQQQQKQSRPEAMAFSPMITSSTSAIVGTAGRIHRSQSTAFYFTSTSPLSISHDASAIRKTHSSNSLQRQRTSFSDDSGFHSEVSSPECSQSTMTSPTTTVAGRKLQKARRSRQQQNQQQQQSSRLLDCFYKI